MNDSVISILAGLLATMFLNPKFEIVKNYLIKRGANIDKINNVYYIYLAVTTFIISAIVYGLIWLVKFILNHKNKDDFYY